MRSRRLRGAHRHAWAVIAGLLLVVGCAGEEPPPIVVVVIDTLRADRLTLDAGPDSLTPEIAALAAAGTRFLGATATAPWTGPSVASILTGRHPSELGIERLKDPLPPDAMPLAVRLRAAGYATGAVVSNAFAGPNFSFDQGYDHFHFESYKSRGARGQLQEEGRPFFTADRVTDAALRWLATAPRPWFLYVHYTDPHAPYLPPKAWREKQLGGRKPLPDELLLGQRFAKTPLNPVRFAALKAHYAGEIAFADHEIGRLLEALPTEAFVVLTADHGEEFRDHGGFLHGATLYQEMLHVPLLLRGPGIPAGREVRQPVSQIDILPTLLELANLDLGAPVSGRSLVPALRSEEGVGERLLFSQLMDGPNRGTAARLGRWKYITSAHGAALFDLETDPGERKDVTASQPELARSLRSAIREFESHVVEPHFDGEEMERAREDALRELGYLE